MMRALGFRRDHVLVFVILQAFTFSIPGVLSGLLISLVLNEGFQEVFFIFVKNSKEYGLPAAAILVSLIIFGIVTPVISIAGPTREALDKNLRSSLDASRRSDESVSYTVTRLKQMGLSRMQILLGIFLFFYGFITYYFIPYSLLKE